MNAFQFGRFVREKMAFGPPGGHGHMANAARTGGAQMRTSAKPAPSPVSRPAAPAKPAAPTAPPPAAAGGSPAERLAAMRVAQVKAEAQKVRDASGTPRAVGSGAHQWSGTVMPHNGGVQGATYQGPAAR